MNRDCHSKCSKSSKKYINPCECNKKSKCSDINSFPKHVPVFYVDFSDVQIFNLLMCNIGNTVGLKLENSDCILRLKVCNVNPLSVMGKTSSGKGPIVIKLSSIQYIDFGQEVYVNPLCSTGSSVGIPGPQGPKGDKGDVGPQGPAGSKGSKGDKGDMGPQGPAGSKGSKGDKGDMGPQGPAGPQGSKGDKGDMGPQGPAGPQGSKGDKGDIGPQGPAGSKGSKGDKGTVGPQGPAGNDGTCDMDSCNHKYPKYEKPVPYKKTPYGK